MSERFISDRFAFFRKGFGKVPEGDLVFLDGLFTRRYNGLSTEPEG